METPGLQTAKPTSVFSTPLTLDGPELFKALAKGVGHTAIGKWEELSADAVDGMAALGLKTAPEELAFLLVRRSLIRAIFQLVGEAAAQLPPDPKKGADELAAGLDFSQLIAGVELSGEFLDRPSQLQVLPLIEHLLAGWLVSGGVGTSEARAIVARLPSYFTLALNQEWRSNQKQYAPIASALETPFTRAGEREWAWKNYEALLERRTNESVFDAPFSLSQIYVPLNAWFAKLPRSESSIEIHARVDVTHVVVSLEEELLSWIQERNSLDAIRILSGGPGSGKSSFARIFAAKVCSLGLARVLFVPLHLLDASRDLVDEVGRFIQDEGVLTQNPLDPVSPEPNLLIVFDGLDELSSQGKAAAETARAFIREVEKTVERRNVREVQLRVLISGRELVVQENEPELRRPRQILNILPYYVPRQPRSDAAEADSVTYEDQKGLLRRDLRNVWWKKYGELVGHGITRLPPELRRRDLEDVTSQPLLNYLVALSFARTKVDFTRDVNLNAIYEDLVLAVHERGYEKHRVHAPIRHMLPGDFFRVLEEIGLASWHGDGRTTTVREIEEHCRNSGLGTLLDVFQEGAKAGVTKLLAAFFFRQYGYRRSGDPTFVFTHKSFGEYLTARRVVRAIERLDKEVRYRSAHLDGGWDEREALQHWALVCGPSAVSRELLKFVRKELQLRDQALVGNWHDTLARLFNFVLANGMPLERVQFPTFANAQFQSRNSEEALFVALNACALCTERNSRIEAPDRTTFGAWFRRIQGQRSGPTSALSAGCLSYLDLSGACLDIADLYGSDFKHSVLRGISAHYACLSMSDFSGADLSGAILYGANLENCDFDGAILREVSFRKSHLADARFENADLRGASVTASELHRIRRGGARIRTTEVILEAEDSEESRSEENLPPESAEDGNSERQLDLL